MKALLILAATQAADAASTAAALARGLVEANPLMADAMGALGAWPAIVVAKALVVSASGALVAAGVPYARAAVLGAAAFYALVVANNVAALAGLLP